ncbi:hypothetical protein D3C76_200450 [compost metagenome]
MADQLDTHAQPSERGEQFLVPLAVKDHHRQLGERFASDPAGLAQRDFSRIFQAEPACQLGAAGQLFHVNIRRMQQAAPVGDRNHRLGIVQPAGDYLCAFQRIHSYINGRAVPVTDLLPDVEHRRFVHFAFANDHSSVDGDGIEHGTDGGSGRIVCSIFVAPANPAGRG